MDISTISNDTTLLHLKRVDEYMDDVARRYVTSFHSLVSRRHEECTRLQEKKKCLERQKSDALFHQDTLTERGRYWLLHESTSQDLIHLLTHGSEASSSSWPRYLSSEVVPYLSTHPLTTLRRIAITLFTTENEWHTLWHTHFDSATEARTFRDSPFVCFGLRPLELRRPWIFSHFPGLATMWLRHLREELDYSRIREEEYERTEAESKYWPIPFTVWIAGWASARYHYSQKGVDVDHGVSRMVSSLVELFRFGVQLRPRRTLTFSSSFSALLPPPPPLPSLLLSSPPPPLPVLSPSTFPSLPKIHPTSSSLSSSSSPSLTSSSSFPFQLLITGPCRLIGAFLAPPPTTAATTTPRESRVELTQIESITRISESIQD